MNNKRKPGGRIPASELTSCKLWRLPRVQSGHVVSSPFQEKNREQRLAVEVADPFAEHDSLSAEELEKIRRQARDEAFKQGLEEGRQQGVKTGEKQGYDAAYKKAGAEITAIKARLASLISNVEAPLEAQRDELEQALLQLVVDTSRAVIKQELKTDSQLLERTVNEAVSALPQIDQPLCLMVHPDDEQVVGEIRDRERHKWEIHPDPKITPGGLRIKGACSYLDYSVEHRFTAVVEQLLKGGSDKAGNNEPAS